MQLLDPQLHTPDWLRLNSPFLATCLAFVASTFDPLSAHQTGSLKTHALQLATEIYTAGLKSLEILQGFYVLSYVLYSRSPDDRLICVRNAGTGRHQRPTRRKSAPGPGCGMLCKPSARHQASLVISLTRL